LKNYGFNFISVFQVDFLIFGDFSFFWAFLTLNFGAHQIEPSFKFSVGFTSKTAQTIPEPRAPPKKPLKIQIDKAHSIFQKLKNPTEK
jgi:hypothetical protein